MATSKAATGRRLVIVESPRKARTIAEYLGPEFDVEASVGHIRDLPQPSELPADMKKGPFGKFAVDRGMLQAYDEILQYVEERLSEGVAATEAMGEALDAALEAYDRSDQGSASRVEKAGGN